MKKFGFGKRSDSDDSGRSSFGKKRPDGQDNPYAQQPSNNPYAQQPADDPYANAPPPRVSPYQQARGSLPSGPRPGGLPSGPGPRSGAGGPGGAGYNTPPPPYKSTAGADTGFANEKYGAQGGYGGNRYDNSAPPNPMQRSAAPVRQGGYGGLGDVEAERDDLFGGARARVQQQQQQPQSQFGGDNRYGNSGTSTTAGGDAYGSYGEQRELTEEEREQEEVRNVKQQIMQTKQESLSSTQRSLAIMNQAIETGSGSLARLGAQGDRLYNTERNLDTA